MQLLCSTISKYKTNCALFYLVGDYNLPFINWEYNTSSTKSGQIFLDFCEDYGIDQHIDESTFISGSILDLLLCDNVSYRKINSIDNFNNTYLYYILRSFPFGCSTFK